MMKSVYTLVAFLLLSFSTAFAQYGNGYGNNGYGGNNGNRYGLNRSLSRDQMDQSSSKPKEIPVEVTVDKIMKKMNAALKLDALQEIAVGNVLKESIGSEGIIIKNEKMSFDQKNKEIQALSETTTRKINEYLNPEQKKIYKELMEAKLNKR